MAQVFFDVVDGNDDGNERRRRRVSEPSADTSHFRRKRVKIEPREKIELGRGDVAKIGDLAFPRVGREGFRLPKGKLGEPAHEGVADLVPQTGAGENRALHVADDLPITERIFFAGARERIGVHALVDENTVDEGDAPREEYGEKSEVGVVGGAGFGKREPLLLDETAGEELVPSPADAEGERVAAKVFVGEDGRRGNVKDLGADSPRRGRAHFE